MSCGTTFIEHNPFALPNTNLTIETINNVLTDLKYPKNTYSAVAKRNNISIQKVIDLFDAYIYAPRNTFPKFLCIDEFYFKSSDYKGKYGCLLLDFTTGEVIDVLQDRKKDYLHSYFQKIPKAELDFVQAVSIDMYEPYKIISKLYFKKAIICIDSFHVIKNMTEAFNKVRIRIIKNSDDEILCYLLTKFKGNFTYKNIKLDNEPQYNRKLKGYYNMRSLFNLAFERSKEIEIVYTLLHNYMYFNDYASADDVEDWLNIQINAFITSEIPEFQTIALTLMNWKEEIINSFKIKVGRRRISNGPIESANRSIKDLFRNANGLVNSKRARNRIMYVLNKNTNYRIR